MFINRFAIPLVLLLACGASRAQGAVFTWSGGSPSGTWSAGGGGWIGGSYPTNGSATDTEAIFSGTTPTAISVAAGGVQANRLSFTAGGYSLSGNTITLNGTTPTISVSTGTATIGSIVAGSAGLVKSGAGMLTFTSASNSYTGGTTISAGTLYLDAASAGSGLMTLGDANTGSNNVQLDIRNSALGNSITVANQGTGTATIRIVNPAGGFTQSLGTVTLNRAATISAPNLTSFLQFGGALAGNSPLTLGTTNNQRFILTGSAASYTGGITVQSGAIFEPRNQLSAATGNSVQVDSGGELRIQFSPSSIGGLDGGGLVRSVSSAAALSVGKGDASGSFTGTMQNGGTTLSFTKIGTGSQELSGANITHTGATTLTQGTLRLTNTSSWNSAVALNAANTVALELNAPGAGDSWTLANTISGGSAANASVVKLGAGTVTLSGAHNFLGATTLTQGTLRLTNTTSWNSAVALSASNTVALELNAAGVGDSWTLGNAITGGSAANASLLKVGAGTVTLSGANSYLGATTIRSGTLRFNSASGAGTGLITLGDAGTGASQVQLTFGNSTADTGINNHITVANAGSGAAVIKVSDIGAGFSGNGTITLNRDATIDASAVTNSYYQSRRALAGTGTLTLTNSNGNRFILDANSSLFTGDVVIQSGGVFEPRNSLSAASGNNITVQAGGVLQVVFNDASIGGLNGDGTVRSNSFGGARTLSLGKGGASGVFSGTLQNNGGTLALTKIGTGSQELSGGNITHTGATTLTQGTLRLTNTSNWNSAITLNAANTVALQLNAPGAGDSWSLANAITGGSAANASVVKLGAGTVTLTGAHTYAGVTNVSAGTLVLNGSLSTASSVVNVNAGATLAGIGTINRLVKSGGITANFAPGNSPGTLSLLGGLDASAGATFNFELGTISDWINLGSSTFIGSTAANGLVFNIANSGGLTTGVAYTLISFGSASGLNYSDLSLNARPLGVTLDASFGNGGWLITGNTLQVQFEVVPEPSSGVLMLAGLSFLAFLQLRRRPKLV